MTGGQAGGVIVQSSGGATRQHYVISSSQAGAGQPQIVALQPGVRPGQIVQVKNISDGSPETMDKEASTQ